MASLISTTPADIDAIKAHMMAGNQVVVVTYTRITKLGPKHVEYIRASKDGKGFRLGWPGKSSVYAFANSVKMVPAGHKI